MIWHILRHAEKAQGDFHNPMLRHQDEPLSTRGQLSAQKLVTHFTDIQIAAIYVSAYQRTGQTIRLVAEHLNIIPVVDEHLNEIDNGDVDEMTAIRPLFRTLGNRAASWRRREQEHGNRQRGKVLFLHVVVSVHATSLHRIVPPFAAECAGPTFRLEAKLPIQRSCLANACHFRNHSPH